MYDYEEEYEPTVEEMEEMDGMENTEVRIEKEQLEIKFNTENFALGIMQAVVSEVKKNLYKEIIAEIKKECLDDIKEKIQLSVHEIIKDIVVDFMENEKVVVGGDSIWDDEPREELSLMQYSKRCIKQILENGKFKVLKKLIPDKYSRERYRAETEEYSFEGYLIANLGIGNEVKAYLDKQVDEVRKQVNKDVKDAFDDSTKQMLSNAVLQVLMANDTYRKIEANIACIADKNQED